MNMDNMSAKREDDAQKYAKELSGGADFLTHRKELIDGGKQFFLKLSGMTEDPNQQEALRDWGNVFEKMHELINNPVEGFDASEVLQVLHEIAPVSFVDESQVQEGGALTNAHVVGRRKVNLNVDEPEAPQHVISRRRVDLSAPEPQQHVISRRKVNLSDE